MKDLVSRQMGREEARVPGICLPSPGGGGSIAKRSGWGDGLPTRALFEGRDGHPTPPLISFASTLPLQGRSEAGRPGMTRGNNAFHRPSRRTTPIGNEARVPGIAYPPLERKGRSRSDRGGVTVSPLVHCSKGGTATPPRRSFHSRRPSPSRGGSEAGRPGMTTGKKCSSPQPTTNGAGLCKSSSLRKSTASSVNGRRRSRSVARAVQEAPRSSRAGPSTSACDQQCRESRRPNRARHDRI